MENTATVKSKKARKIATTHFIAHVGMLGAIAAILMFFEIPLPFIAPAFYKMDFSEVPVLIGTFALGPIGGFFIEVIKILVHLAIKGTSTAFIGELGNLVVGAALFLPAGILYKIKKTRKCALIGMIVGTVCMVLVGSFFNAYVLLPLYAKAFGGMEAIIAAGTAVHASVTSVAGFVGLCVAPFNLVKGIITSIITCILYKRVSIVIKRRL